MLSCVEEELTAACGTLFLETTSDAHVSRGFPEPHLQVHVIVSKATLELEFVMKAFYSCRDGSLYKGIFTPVNFDIV